MFFSGKRCKVNQGLEAMNHPLSVHYKLSTRCNLGETIIIMSI